jgi:hypothetical protein
MTFDYGSIPYETWKEFAATVGADERHLKFAAAKFRGCTNTQAAREAGFGPGGGTSTRSEGYRVARSNKINQLLALAAAEAGGGYDGTLSKQEGRSILTAMARGSDPQVRIKAIELLHKMEEKEAALNATKPEESLEENLAALITLVPEQGAGAFLALSGFIHAGGFIGSFPFLAEIAPLLSRHYPGDWQRWRAREKHQWVTDFLDKAAAGPLLEDNALIAAVKHKSPVVRPTKPTAEVADNG